MTQPEAPAFNQAQEILNSYKRNAANDYANLLERIAVLETAVAERDHFFNANRDKFEVQPPEGQTEVIREVVRKPKK